MRLLTFWDAKTGAELTCYTDLVGCDDYTDYMYLLSVVGPERTIKLLEETLRKESSLLRVSPLSSFSWSGEDSEISYAERFSSYSAMSKGAYSVIKSKIDDLTHAIFYYDPYKVKRINNDSDTEPEYSIFAWNGDIVSAFYKFLYNNYSVPLKPEWADWLYQRASSENYLRPITIRNYGSKETNLAGAVLKMSETELEDMVSDGVKNQEIVVSPNYTDELDGIRSLSSYLQTFNGMLVDRITSLFTPRHDPLSDELNPLIGQLKRHLFRAQADVLQGCVNTLKTESMVVVNGEMGTGKSLIGAGIPYVYANGKPYRAIVMCPGHLVNKWVREIENTVPNASAHILNSYTDILRLRNQPKQPSSIEYYIISKDKAKLSYAERHGAVWDRVNNVWRCPDCWSMQVDTEGNVVDDPNAYDKKTAQNAKCTNKACRSKLWQADNNRYRRFAPAVLVKRYLKGYFDYFIADEFHEFRGDTAQGEAFALLAQAAKKTIGLTGTILGGYARDLFYLLFRANPKKMLAEGLTYNDLGEWIRRYGVVETVATRTESFRRRRRRSKTDKKLYQRPGVSPVIFGKFLLNNCAFLQLEDLRQGLPSYNEYVELVNMNDDLHDAYEALSSTLCSRIGGARNQSRYAGRYLQTLLSYPDKPFGWETIYDEDGNAICTPTELSSDTVYPKERKLIEIVRNEIAAGRKCMVYTVFTGKVKQDERIKEILQAEGFKVAVLKSSVSPANREKWINDRVKQGVDVIVCNPRLVETGLDLMDFPTLIHYQTGYNLFTMRQASRRSWRIGQKKPVKVYFIAYRDTVQEVALRLMGSKLESSLAIEGKFSEEGLLAMSDGLDVANELARILVNGMSGVESAETIWARINDRMNAYMENSADEEVIVEDLGDENGTDIDVSDDAVSVEAEVEPQVTRVTWLEFIQMHKSESKTSRRKRNNKPQVDIEQFALFELGA